MKFELNEQLEQAQQGLARLHKIDNMLKELHLELQNLKKYEIELKRILAKENIDVEKLEIKNLVAFFYSLVGSLDEKIEKERREALAAKLKYDQAVNDLKDIEVSISKLTVERSNYLNCQSEYDVLYAQKKQMLLEENSEAAQKILELIDEANNTRINLKEIDEALTAGKQVVDSFNSALSSLSSAEGWGTWDLLGGGFISDLAKYSHLNSAQGDIDNAQRLLRQFKTELTDIRIGADLSLRTEGFIKFADFFFDGLIADWFMQSRINESQASVKRVKKQVASIIYKLEQKKSQGQDHLHRLESDIDRLVVKA